MAKRLVIPPPQRNKYDPERLGAASDAGWRNFEVIAAIIAVAEKIQLAQDKFVGPSVDLYLKKFMKKRD